jgi:hypothetical protein
MSGLLRDSPDDTHFRLRLTMFADAALALAEALERIPDDASFERLTEAVRREFGHLPVPPAGDPCYAAWYGVARGIATQDCDFVLWAAARRDARGGRPDPLYAGFARWLREQLGLLGG